MLTKNTLTTGLFLLLSITAFSQLPSYISPMGLQAWYPFNNNSNDLSGSGNNATNYFVTYTTDRAGNANAAASFNGTTAWLSVPVPSFTFSATGAFTYSLWVKKQTQTSAGIVMMVGSNATGNFISILQGPTQMQFGTNKQQSAWIWVTCSHVLNQWDHYVATYDAGIMKLYRNGVYQSTGTFTHTGTTSANLPLSIGRGLASGTNYVGDIDDIAIWNRALSQSEITNLYFNSISTGITENTKNDFTIFPNPASDVLNVIPENSTSETNYTIIDISGKTVLTGSLVKETQIQIDGLPSGEYFIFMNEKKDNIKRFVIE
jgi:Concanavalin A-like lectin/glucanases superfamily/Secretion system C-terminal sorting domain